MKAHISVIEFVVALHSTVRLWESHVLQLTSYRTTSDGAATKNLYLAFISGMQILNCTRAKGACFLSSLLRTNR